MARVPPSFLAFIMDVHFGNFGWRVIGNQEVICLCIGSPPFWEAEPITSLARRIGQHKAARLACWISNRKLFLEFLKPS
jgi:hypothetical protein